MGCHHGAPVGEETLQCDLICAHHRFVAQCTTEPAHDAAALTCVIGVPHTDCMNPMIPPFRLIVCIACALSLCSCCASSSPTVTTTTGLGYQIVTAGNGPAALPGQSVRIHETTTLADGTLIYSTRTSNNPLTFRLGGNQVIAGVDEGVTGMKVGERRRLIVPPALSKRSVYPANTPPDATLYYDIELLEILGN